MSVLATVVSMQVLLSSAKLTTNLTAKLRVVSHGRTEKPAVVSQRRSLCRLITAADNGSQYDLIERHKVACRCSLVGSIVCMYQI